MNLTHEEMIDLRKMSNERITPGYDASYSFKQCISVRTAFDQLVNEIESSSRTMSGIREKLSALSKRIDVVVSQLSYIDKCANELVDIAKVWQRSYKCVYDAFFCTESKEVNHE